MRFFVLGLFLTLPAGWTAEHNSLLPRPQEVRYGAGRLVLRGLTIRFSSAPSADDRFAAEELSSALSVAAHSPVSLVDSAGSGREIVFTRTGNAPALPASDERGGREAREAYTLKVTPQGAEVRAKSSAGLFYAVQTLCQLVEVSGEQAVLPEVEIQDWPSLAYRGFMMDTSHGQLPTEDEIKRQIDFLSRWKANQYYFYSEASIEVRGYPLVNPAARYSQEQIKRLIAYARERHVDVVPCMEFFGHMHDVFRVERYSDMASLRYGGEFNPRDPRVRAFLEEWVGQMAELFPSPWFHIGFDEPWALELFGSRATGVPAGELYIEHLKNVAAIVRKHGKRMMFWADMASGARIFSHYPELISQLPPGAIAVPWHYRAEKDYTRIVAPLEKAGLPMVVAPARLERLRARESELRQARLSAEEAQEHLQRALSLNGDAATLSSLLLGARMLDYLGMKNLYSIEIAGYFRRLEPNPQRDLVNLLLRIQTGSQNHGLIQDLLDSITELRELYRQAWQSEYRSYRLGTALGRWDAEYEYWRSMQAKFQGLNAGEPVPPLDRFRHGH